MRSFRYAATSLLRGGKRSLAYLIGLGLALALFSSTLFFIDGSARTLTQRAIAPVLLDFQARSVDPLTDVTRYQRQLGAIAGVSSAQPFVSAAIGVLPPAGASSSSGASAANSVSAPVAACLFAAPPSYLAHVGVLRLSAGAFPAGGALISEQLALGLHATIGDQISLAVPGVAAPYPVVITGVVNTDLADPLFSGPGAANEGAYTNTSEAIILDYTTYARDLSAGLQGAAVQASNSATANPAATQGLPLLDRQVHIQIDRVALPADPAAAQAAIGALSHRLERQAPGQIRITDNLSNALTNATKDVVAARLLFVFLGLPGVLLAAYLSRYATQLVTEAQRREIALLRTRGFSPRQVLKIMGWVAALVAIMGTLVGLIIGAASIVLLFGPAALTQSAGVALTIIATLALGCALGAAGVYWPARRMVESEVNEERRIVSGAARPLWLRLPLDIGLLAAGALALWVNSANSTPGATEGAAVSLGVASFVGPLLCWLGAGLLAARGFDWFLSRAVTPWSGGLRGLASRSLRQRRQQGAGIAVLLALALSFGVTTTVFSSSYAASRQAESRYYVGSDIRITPSVVAPQAPSFATQLRVPGVQAVTPVFVNNQALLGTQTQTVYGVDMASLPQATTIPDSFFVGDTAHAALGRLAATPNGLLMSKELATAYNVLNGDLVRMRIPSASGALSDVSLKVVGIFVQFPTSSQNSDLVVNSALLTSTSHSATASFFLVKTDGAAASNDRISQTLSHRFRVAQISARIETATQVISQDQSSLAGLNLAGLAAIDRIYAALIIALGLGVFLFGMLLERQREFGTLQALGATRIQVLRILAYEGGVLALAGALAGALIGGVIAWQYTGFLPSIFSVTLPVVALPWQQLSVLLLMGLVGTLAASAAAIVRLYRLWPAEALRDTV
ncbi:MAG TPA: FtsX-like permease family protein [Ktedonobacterales bacterium]|nr:FtsX-like permease family protein [Ktedonobacterales bacterium]